MMDGWIVRGRKPKRLDDGVWWIGKGRKEKETSIAFLCPLEMAIFLSFYFSFSFYLSIYREREK